MTISLDAFVAEWDGKRITAPGGIGGECVDLANEYILEVFGFPHEWKNALDWFGASPDKFDWVLNDPKNLTQLPPRGALMVWGPGPYTGPNGQHIDVVLSAGPQNFVGFDQNWPIGANAHHVVHDYVGAFPSSLRRRQSWCQRHPFPSLLRPLCRRPRPRRCHLWLSTLPRYPNQRLRRP
jgi:hypothetical protein